MSNPEIVRWSLHDQMDKLIVQPIEQSYISTVIVIDGLDECEDNETTSAILRVLSQTVTKIDKVKFFITSRPEPRIRNGFRLQLLARETVVFDLHEVRPDQVKNDMWWFYKHSCSEIKGHQDGLDDWPTEEQLNQLCEHAAGLFIYAMATIRFIGQTNKNPKTQLDRLIKSPESGSEGKVELRKGMTLDSFYRSILHKAFGDNDPEDDPKVQSVLGAVALAANPLSLSTIATLLGLDIENVVSLLSSVHSLLILPEDINHPLQPFHKSFADFIVDTAKYTVPRFHVHPPDQHTELLVSCLELMNQKLERNMCRLPDRVTNIEVKDLQQRAEQFISGALGYACQSWHKHLISKTPAHKKTITPVLLQFLEEKFLFWLEVLSILGATREAVYALEETIKWLNVCCISFCAFQKLMC